MDFRILFVCLDLTTPWGYSKSRTERFNNPYETRCFSRSHAKLDRIFSDKSFCLTERGEILYYGQFASYSRPNVQDDYRRFDVSLSRNKHPNGRKSSSVSTTESAVRRARERAQQYQDEVNNLEPGDSTT